MSASNLLRVFNKVDNFSKEKYTLDCVTNEYGLKLSKGGEIDTSCLTLVLALHDKIPSIDLRNWSKPQP